MRRNLVLGAWYVLLFAAAIMAEQRLVSSKDPFVRSDTTEFSDEVGRAKSGDRLETTGKTQDGWVEVKLPSGKVGWIAESDLYSAGDEKTMSETSGAGGGGTANTTQEGAYVKGFDPEVEGQLRKDDPGLSKVYELEVLPWIYETRGLPELEVAEEHLELLLMQNKKDTPEAEQTRKQIEELRLKAQPIRDRWQDELRTFRKNGNIGEFAGRK
ncbi:MAG: SH3 domain-containing protein [Planctomycetes bacterium]|nr:SH3 domain-containing protein [Planctomycetota bacterium]